jgi:hypothetical protein
MSALHKLLYRRIIFCPKCHRSMFVGLNGRYVAHLLRHTVINKILILLAVVGVIPLVPSSISIMSSRKVGLADYISEEEYKQERVVHFVLKKSLDLEAEEISRLTKTIVRHSLDKKLDPKLVASIIVVESRGNPLAISGSKAVGIMQIHVPTWKEEVDFTEKNPFDPEVNIDIGTTILAHYLKQYRGDLESALVAYEGARDPAQDDYLTKIMDIYRSRTP